MSDQRYQAGGPKYLYPLAGDPRPFEGAKVQLLTIGGVHTNGPWIDNGFYLGWLELPKRDTEKEERIEKLMGTKILKVNDEATYQGRPVTITKEASSHDWILREMRNGIPHRFRVAKADVRPIVKENADGQR